MARLFTRRRGLVLLGLVVLAVAACNIAVLVRGTPFAGSAGSGVADCALVLGAGVYADGSVSPVLEDRLETALALYRDARVARILVSGDHATSGYDEVNAMRRWLEARGVPPRDVFLDHAGLDTYSSVWRARDVFHVRRVIVVTQRFHLPRALFLARSLGLDASGAPADRRPYRGAVYLEAREVLSRTRAVIDVATRRVPRHRGTAIPIDGESSATRDG